MMKKNIIILFLISIIFITCFSISYSAQNSPSETGRSQIPVSNSSNNRQTEPSLSESERHHYYTEQLNNLLLKVQTSHMNIQAELKTMGELVASSPDIHTASIKLREVLKGSNTFETAFFAYSPGAGIRGKTHAMIWYIKKRNNLAKINPDFKKYDYLKKKWYLRPMRTGLIYYTDPYTDASGTSHIISAVVAVYKSGKPVGVAGADIPLGRITHNINSLRFGNKGFAFLLKGSGLVLAHPNPAYIGSKNINKFMQSDSLFNTGETDPQINALSQVMLVQRKKDKALITDSHSGKKYIAYFGPIIGTDWALCIMIQMM